MSCEGSDHLCRIDASVLQACHVRAPPASHLWHKKQRNGSRLLCNHKRRALDRIVKLRSLLFFFLLFFFFFFFLSFILPSCSFLLCKECVSTLRSGGYRSENTGRDAKIEPNISVSSLA